MKIGFGPWVLFKITKCWEIKRLELQMRGGGFYDRWKPLRGKKLQQQQIDTLCKVRDMFRTESNGDVTSSIIQPQNIGCWGFSLVILKVPAIAENYTKERLN